MAVRMEACERVAVPIRALARSAERSLRVEPGMAR